MKLSAEERTAQSLNKEYLMFKKYASRPGASALEADYFSRMAGSTAAKIDWKLLRPHKKVQETDGEYDETYGVKESRNRYHK
jgi:hypothetical protein